MLPHSKLTKAAGFIDDEGAIVIRGRAEPPFPQIWSRGLANSPSRLWEHIGIDCNNKIKSYIGSPISDFIRTTPLGILMDNYMNGLITVIEPGLSTNFLLLHVHVRNMALFSDFISYKRVSTGNSSVEILLSRKFRNFSATRDVCIYPNISNSGYCPFKEVYKK